MRHNVWSILQQNLYLSNRYISLRKQSEVYSSACIWFICCTKCLKLNLAYFTMTWLNCSLLSTHGINTVPCKNNLIYSNTSFAKQVNVHMCCPGHNVFRKKSKVLTLHMNRLSICLVVLHAESFLNMSKLSNTSLHMLQHL